MNTAAQNAHDTLSADDVTHAIAGFRKDAARRAQSFEPVFGEIAKTLGVMSGHPLLQADIQFQGLLADLIGVEDMQMFQDRVMALETYVNRVAQAHGVTLPQATNGGSANIVLRQTPEHLAGLDEDLAHRTRLTMR